MPKLIKCIACNEAESQPVCIKNSYQVVKCKKCGLQYVNPIPAPGEIYELYHQGTLIQESGTEKPGKDGFVIQPSWKIEEFSQILQGISELTNPGRILEVGSLWGLFLELAQEAGWETYGIELWSEAVEYCQKKMGLNVLLGTLEDATFPRNYFDAIVMLDVLEHCPHPKDDLTRINRLLKKNGVLCVLSPNSKGLLPQTSCQWHRLTRQAWTYLTPPFHLYDFTPSALIQLLGNEGFQVITVNYLGMDSRIQLSMEKISLREVAKKTLSFIGKNLHMGDRMVIYARKQNLKTSL